MQQLLRFQDGAGRRFSVPEEERDQFLAETPDAVPLHSFRDAGGRNYSVPEPDLDAFKAETPDAQPVRRVQSADGARFSVPDSDRDAFLKDYRARPEFEEDRAAARGRARAAAGTDQSVAGAAARGAVEGFGRGLAAGAMELGGVIAEGTAGAIMRPAARLLGAAGVPGMDNYIAESKRQEAELRARADEMRGTDQPPESVLDQMNRGWGAGGVRQAGGLLTGIGLLGAAAPTLGAATLPALGAVQAYGQGGGPKEMLEGAVGGAARQVVLGGAQVLPPVGAAAAGAGGFAAIGALEGERGEELMIDALMGGAFAAQASLPTATRAGGSAALARDTLREAVRPLVQSDWWRNLTVRERGMVLRSAEAGQSAATLRSMGAPEALARKVEGRLTEAQRIRAGLRQGDRAAFEAARQARMTGEATVAPTAEAPSGQSAVGSGQAAIASTPAPATPALPNSPLPVPAFDPETAARVPMLDTSPLPPSPFAAPPAPAPGPTLKTAETIRVNREVEAGWEAAKARREQQLAQEQADAKTAAVEQRRAVRAGTESKAARKRRLSLDSFWEQHHGTFGGLPMIERILAGQVFRAPTKRSGGEYDAWKALIEKYPELGMMMSRKGAGDGKGVPIDVAAIEQKTTPDEMVAEIEREWSEYQAWKARGGRTQEELHSQDVADQAQANLTTPAEVTPAQLKAGDMVRTPDGQWRRVEREPDTVILADGTDIAMPEESAEKLALQAHVPADQPGIDEARQAYTEQERAMWAEAERERIAAETAAPEAPAAINEEAQRRRGAETVSPSPASRPPSPDTLSLQGQTQAEMDAQAAARQTEAQRQEMLARAAAPLPASTGDQTAIIPGMENEVDANLFDAADIEARKALGMETGDARRETGGGLELLKSELDALLAPERPAGSTSRGTRGMADVQAAPAADKRRAIVEAAARFVALNTKAGEAVSARNVLAPVYGDKLAAMEGDIQALAAKMVATREAELYVGVKLGDADASGEAGQQAIAAGTAGGPSVPGATGGAGRRGRTDIRMAGARDLPQPRDHVASGSYDIDEDQRLGVNLFLDRVASGGRGFLLGDGTGVGKTSQMLVAAHEYAQRTGERVLIVTENEATIRGTFTSDAKRLGFDLDKFDLTTYTALRGRDRDGKPNPQVMRNVRADGKPSKVSIRGQQYGLVIFDEAHNLKNSDSQKTFQSQRFAAGAKHVMYATATPMDTPTGAAYFMSEVTGVPQDRMADMLGFTFATRKDQDGNEYQAAVLKQGYSWNDVLRSLMRLRTEAVKQGALVRREYPFLGTFHEIEVPLDTADMQEQRMIADFYDRIIAHYPANASMARRNWAGQKTFALSHWLEARKIPAVVRQVKESLAAGRTAVVVCEYVNPSDRLTQRGTSKTVRRPWQQQIWNDVFGGYEPKLGGTISEMAAILRKEGIPFAEVYGDNDKAGQVSRFQGGEVPVVLMTGKSGGTGINLDDTLGDRPRDMFVLSTDFAGDKYQQILGRISRRNTASESRVFFLYAGASFSDMRRREINNRKLEILKRVQRGEDIDAVQFEPDVTPEGPAARPSAAGGGARGMAQADGTGLPGQMQAPDAAAVPADNPHYSIFPIELPEAVDFARQATGKFPKVKKRIRLLGGTALGVYRSTPQGPLGIELKRSIFELVTDQDRIRIAAEAEAWAAVNLEGNPEGELWTSAVQDRITEETDKLREQRLKENPRLASSVLLHEIGHWIDNVPDYETMMKRGNILGHLQALHGYTKQMMMEHPDTLEAAIPPRERARMRREAERAAGRRPADDAERKVWSEEVSTHYQDMLQEEAARRGLVTRAEILSELEPLIAWWHGTDSIPEYFTDPAEMYADAFSVLANNPAAMRKRAPTYFKVWQNWLAKRPQARELWERYQMDATLGRVGDMRDRRQMEGIEAANFEHEKQLRARMVWSPRQNLDALGSMLYSGAYPITRRAKKLMKRGAESGDRMMKALQDERYRHAWGAAYMMEVQDKVGRRVFAEAGVPLAEWRAFLQNRQIAENRQGIASMMGMNPAASSEALERQRQRMGDAAYNAMMQAQAQWHALRQKYVINLALEKGLVTQELADLMEQRAAYSHVAAVDADVDPVEAIFRGTYGEAGAKIYKQEGFLGLARDPWQATLELDRSLITAAYRNELKAALESMLADSGEELYRDAGTKYDANVKRMVPVTGESARASTLVYMRNGKPRSYWAPQEIVDFVDNADPVSARVLTSLINTLLRKQKGIFTWLNYGFPIFNTPRDIQDWIRNLPGWKGRLTYYHYAKRARPLVQSIVDGRPTEEAAELMRQNILLLYPQGLEPGQDRFLQSLGQKIGGRVGRALEATGPQTALERTIQGYGLRPEWMGMDVNARHDLMQRVKRWYLSPTEKGEMLRKVSAWLYLRDRFPDMSAEDVQRNVQMMGGSPDFADRARKNAVIDAVFPFYNPFLRGWQSALTAFAREPVRVTLTTMRYTIVPKLILAAIGAGYMRELLKRLLGDLGDEIGKEQQKMVQYIPQYYKDNYAVHPLWWDPTDPTGTKVVFETSPLSEFNRFAGATIWSLLDGGDIKSILDVGAEQLPGINPVLTLASQWAQVYSGRPPAGTGITQTQIDAGAAVSPMMRETWNQLSGGMLGRIPREGIGDVNLSPLEKFLRLPGVSNTLGRRLRVSNKGFSEGLREAAKPAERERAKVRTEAWRDALEYARTGTLPVEAAVRQARGAMTMAMKPDGRDTSSYLALLPVEQSRDAYYVERLHDYMLQMNIAKLAPREQAMLKAPWTQKAELLRGYGKPPVDKPSR